MALHVEGYKTYSEVERAVMSRYFFFHLANVFVTIGAGSIKDVSDVWLTCTWIPLPLLLLAPKLQERGSATTKLKKTNKSETPKLLRHQTCWKNMHIAHGFASCHHQCTTLPRWFY